MDGAPLGAVSANKDRRAMSYCTVSSGAMVGFVCVGEVKHGDVIGGVGRTIHSHTPSEVISVIYDKGFMIQDTSTISFNRTLGIRSVLKEHRRQ